MKTVIEMAREAGLCTWLKPPEYFVERIERFAELVRADEAEKFKWDIHSCGPTCTKIGCVAVREAVKAEREACAKLLEEAAKAAKNADPQGFVWQAVKASAEVIRARSKDEK